MHFGENQLSPSLFGLSPLPTGHPPCFQPRWVTPASACPWVDHPASGLPHATERPFKTRFRSGSPSRVNLATYGSSLAHSSKGTPSRPAASTSALAGTGALSAADDALTVCKPTVSGTISLPSRGAFHLSLTVLVRYRSPVST